MGQIAEIVWSQFSAGLAMLECVIKNCNMEFWERNNNFGYKVYHMLFWTDYFLTLEPTEFTTSEPFTLAEFENYKESEYENFSQLQLLIY